MSNLHSFGDTTGRITSTPTCGQARIDQCTIVNGLGGCLSFAGDEGFYTSADGSIPWVVSPVLIPAAVWLFGSGLPGLVGIARRKKAAQPLK